MHCSFNSSTTSTCSVSVLHHFCLLGFSSTPQQQQIQNPCLVPSPDAIRHWEMLVQTLQRCCSITQLGKLCQRFLETCQPSVSLKTAQLQLGISGQVLGMKFKRTGCPLTVSRGLQCNSRYGCCKQDMFVHAVLRCCCLFCQDKKHVSCYPHGTRVLASAHTK